MSGTQDIVIAAGAEGMTRVPMFSNVALHQKAGIGVDPFSERIKQRFSVDNFSQFDGAEMIARKYGFSRETPDRFALESHRRALGSASCRAPRILRRWATISF
jgi:acetyl-CoA C-acetyltransferase